MSKSDVTHWLSELNAGQSHALDHLLPIVYRQLRDIAQQHLGRERSGHTLNPTALVHEAYIKIANQSEIDWQNRAHFFAIASRSMRRILVDYARSRNAQKRGGKERAVTLNEEFAAAEMTAENVIDLDVALTRLAELNDRLATIVEHRFFGGLSIEETAHVLNVSPMTVKRDWRKAKAFLARELMSPEGSAQ